MKSFSAHSSNIRVNIPIDDKEIIVSPNEFLSHLRLNKIVDLIRQNVVIHEKRNIYMVCLSSSELWYVFIYAEFYKSINARLQFFLSI